MIEYLDILNGNLDLKFNEYTYNYTVKVDDDVTYLDFKYKLNDGVNIDIRNNNINDNNNIVYIDVYDEKDMVTYTFNVYKEKSDLMIGIDNYKKSLEIVEVDNNYMYKLEGLCVGVFLMIVIVFSIIFKRKKKL